MVAVRRTAGAAAESPDADAVYPPAGLRTLLGESDYVVVIVPFTPETAGLLGKAELALMKPGAVLINIGRGQLVDEAALAESLRSGHLGGAALDVFATEPLPKASPLWDLPNVVPPCRPTRLASRSGRAEFKRYSRLTQHLIGI